MYCSVASLVPGARHLSTAYTLHFDISLERAILPPPPRQLHTPHPAEQILALVFVLRIELHLLLGDPLPVIPTTIFLAAVLERATAFHHPPGFEDELADLVALRVFLCVDVLPPQHGAAAHAADVADSVGAGDELSEDGAVGCCVGEVFCWR